MTDLKDRIAIVTGASMGIGAAIARALADEGCHVALAARSADRIEALAAEIRRHYDVKALAIPTDMADPAQVEELVRRTEEGLGGVDILVNNAGVGIYGDMASVRDADLRYVFDVNFFGPVRAMQAAVPAMRRRGGGTVVNISSTAGKVPMPLGGGYSATKFALQAASTAARAELSRDNIHVIVICPGITDTEFSAHSRISVPGVSRSDGEVHSPLRGVSPERVARRAVQAIRRREREVYVTWFDRLLVGMALAHPRLTDWGLRVATDFRRWRFQAAHRSRDTGGGTRWGLAARVLPAVVGLMLLVVALRRKTP